MTHQQLRAQFNRAHIIPTIINSADATHYLVGGEDHQGNFYHLTDKQQRPVLYRSLEQAKLQMKHLGVKRASFELNSAYNEMIGMAPSRSSKSSIGLVL